MLRSNKDKSNIGTEMIFMEYKIIILRADIDEEDTLPDKDTDEIWKGEVFN